MIVNPLIDDTQVAKVKFIPCLQVKSSCRSEEDLASTRVLLPPAYICLSELEYTT